MTVAIDTFADQDKQVCLDLWDQAGPWTLENNRSDIPADYRMQGGGTQLIRAVEKRALQNSAGKIIWACNRIRKDPMDFFKTFEAEYREETVFTNWLEREVKRSRLIKQKLGC